MTIDVRLEHAHFAHRADAILQHAAVVAKPQPDRPALVVFRSRDDLVQAFFGEKLGPALELVVVDGVCVFHHEPRDHVAHRKGHLDAVKSRRYPQTVAVMWTITHHPSPITNSHIHELPVDVPETAYRCLGRTRRLRSHAGAAHFDYGHAVEIAAYRLLHEAADHAVFHRNQPGRTHQVRLLVAHVSLLFAVFLETHQRPHELAVAWAVRDDLARGK